MKLLFIILACCLAWVSPSMSEVSGLFPVSALAEVRIEGGIARATSQWTAPWTADKAFILGHANAWHNDVENGRIFPQTVWYEFPAGKRFVPGRVSFHGRQDSNSGPATWQFVGSNDESCDQYSRWTVLCQDLSKDPLPHKAWTQYCDVDDKIISEFRCLGIAVLNVFREDGFAGLKDVRMWKKVFQ